MHRKHVLVLWMAFIVSFTSLAGGGITFHKLSLEEGLARAKAENKNLFIDVYADWCGPCKYLEKEIFVEDDLGEYMDKNFVSIRLDGEVGDGAMLMDEFNLTAYPTMLFLNPEGKLQKKLVGAVSADVIQTNAEKVAYPEKTKIYQLQKKYDQGERSKIFLSEYISELILEEREVEEVIEFYLEKYPELNLELKSDFQIFCFGIEDLDNKHTVTFLNSVGHFKDKFPDLSEQKMGKIITGILETAIETKNPEFMKTRIEQLYDPYKIVFGQYAYDKADLIKGLMDAYENSL